MFSEAKKILAAIENKKREIISTELYIFEKLSHQI